MPFRTSSIFQKLTAQGRSASRNSEDGMPSQDDLPPPYEPNPAVTTSEKPRGSEKGTGNAGESSLNAAASTSDVKPNKWTNLVGRSEKLSPNLYMTEDSPDLKLPPTARYMLGFDDDMDHLRKTWNPPNPIDPALLDFELVCLLCHCGRSRCVCVSQTPTIALRITELPATKKPYGTFSTPVLFMQQLGMRTTHIAASVAGTFWPLMSLGMIPIFDADTLVILTSRTMERATSSRDVVAAAAKPVTRSTESICCCGCRETICAQVGIKHGLYEDPKALSAAKAVTYNVGTGAMTAVDLGNGITCVSTRNEPPVDVDTDFMEDFVLLRAIQPCSSWRTYGPSKRADLPSWDTVVSSVVANTLRRSAEPNFVFERVPLWVTNSHPEGSRLVVRGEYFSAGTGYMVLDLADAMTMGQTNELMPPYSWSLPVQLRLSKYSPKTHSTHRDCRTAPIGSGWADLKFDMETYVKYPQFGLPQSGIVVSFLPPGRPRRGLECAKHCKGKVMAVCNGFSAPHETETTVYVLGNDPLPYLAVSQYSYETGKELYFVDNRACLGCTVVKVPAGSIVAGVLPKVSI